MCNTEGCPNFDNPKLCTECAYDIADLKAQVARLAREVSLARSGDDGKTRQVSEIIAEAKAGAE